MFETALEDEDLPDPLPLGRTINVFYEVAESLSEERSARGIFQVRAGGDREHGYFLDYYREIQSPMLISVHGRIRQDGSTEELESLRTYRHSPDPATARRERERIAEHNRRVTDILRRKGFR